MNGTKIWCQCKGNLSTDLFHPVRGLLLYLVCVPVTGHCSHCAGNPYRPGRNPGQKDLGIAGIVVGSVGVALAVSIVVIYIVMHGSAASDGVTGAWNAISRLG